MNRKLSSVAKPNGETEAKSLPWPPSETPDTRQAFTQMLELATTLQDAQLAALKSWSEALPDGAGDDGSVDGIAAQLRAQARWISNVMSNATQAQRNLWNSWVESPFVSSPTRVSGTPDWPTLFEQANKSLEASWRPWMALLTSPADRAAR